MNIKSKFETSTIIAFAIITLLLLALLIAAFVTKDGAVVSDLSKNFIGPALLLVVGFYFGSTNSSKSKDDTINNLSEGDQK